jgi:hypothetical protein
MNNNKVINPHTGRLITIGGRTYNKVFMVKNKKRSRNQKGGGIFDGLLNKAKTMENSNQNPDADKFQMIPSKLEPDPQSTDHSWYHHHAPFAQTFGDYVCLKKSTLKELGSFLGNNIK